MKTWARSQSSREPGLAQVPGRHRHVGARRHVPGRRDAAVVLAGGAGAVGVVGEERRAGVELVEHPPEVRRALGADQEAVGPADRHAPGILPPLEEGARRGAGRGAARALRARQVREDLLVLARGDVGEPLAPARPDEEEEVQHARPELPREVDHPGDLADVPVGDAHVEREVDALGPEGLGRPHGALPGPGEVAELVVARGIGRVEGEGRALDPVRLHEARLLLAQEDAVGPEHDREAVLAPLRRQLEDVPPEERLAAGEDQEGAGIDPGDVGHHPAALVGRELAGRRGAGRRADVAVGAEEVAALGQVPGDRVRLVGHSMTSSARASTEGGIVSPRALAVRRLMISSNFVGCSTGRSAGLAPFRILST